MRPILSLLVASLLLAGPVHALPPEKDAWIEIKTPSFVLFSDAGEKNARQVAESLERLRSVLGQLNPGLKLTAPNPTYVFVFRNNGAFRPYRRIYNGRPVDVGGYFITRPEANWVAINGDPRTDEEAIINHEYLHYILRNNYPSLPLWFNEGMAEVYSSFQATAREARIGIPIPEHVYWLRQHDLIPPARLFAIDQTAPDYNEGARRGVFYAESWALVHYLLVGSPEHQKKAPDYLREMARDQPAPDAFRAAFGLDDATLEQEIHAYVRKHLFEVKTVPVQPNEAFQITRRDLPRAEALARLGGLLVSLDPSLWPAAAEHFQAALAQDPAQPQALAGRGWLESLAGHPQEARPWLEKAATRAPDDFVIQYLYGLALLEGTPSPADLRQARRAFTQAVALQPDFGEAWARLAFAQAQDDTFLLEALHSFETAHRLLPSHTDIAYNLALAYARSGQRDRAQEIIDHVLAVHGTPDEVQKARAALIQEKRRDVEDLIEKSDLEGAAALLDQLTAQSPTPEQKTALLARLDEVRHVLAYNRFVGRYNKAMELAGRDPKAAIAILEDLVATTSEPGQLEQARKVLASLKGERW
ncbi:MAG TPA: tetratricopeptide repeat protein [Thermoanaerobaculia bacterium]